MKTLLCWMFCPRYFADMPEDKPGRWVAVAIKNNAWRGNTEEKIREVEGLRRAYRVARWLALKLDWEVPRVDGLGVQWAVRKASEIKP